MVLTGHSGNYTIGRLTETEVNVMLTIVRTADRRCFEEQDDDGAWYSNDDFILTLSDDERTALRNLGDAIELIYSE